VQGGFGTRLRAALLAGRRASVRGYGIVSPRRSDGYEFAELRGYVDGDDPRRIDWAATARAGALQTRVMLEDVALVIAVAVDASASMAVGRARSNYDVACAAAGAWFSAAADDDRCARVGESLLALPGARGRTAALVCAAAREPAGLPLERELDVALALLPRSARLLIASDFFELAGLRERLRACAARFEATALIIGDPWREGLPLGGFVRLRDAETGDSARYYVDRGARRRYAAAVAARESALLGELAALGLRAAVLPHADDPEAVLARTFGFG